MPVPRPIGGVIIPLTTPFTTDGDIDEAAFVAEIEWLLAERVDGVVVGGSTGEGFALNEAELVRLVGLATAAVAGRVPVLASIIADSTRAALHRADPLEAYDLAALQVAPPHYIFSPSGAGLVDFFATVAGAARVPVVIYNVVPWANVSAALAAEIMAAAPSVVAIKQSDKDFGAYAALVRDLGPARVFAAIDGALMSCYELGAAGSIAAIASASPRASVALWRAVQDGRRRDALALHAGLLDVWSSLAAPNLPARVKAAQTIQGVPAGVPRSPMLAASDAERTAIAAALARLDVVLAGLRESAAGPPAAAPKTSPIRRRRPVPAGPSAQTTIKIRN